MNLNVAQFLGNTKLDCSISHLDSSSGKRNRCPVIDVIAIYRNNLRQLGNLWMDFKYGDSRSWWHLAEVFAFRHLTWETRAWSMARSLYINYFHHFAISRKIACWNTHLITFQTLIQKLRLKVVNTQVKWRQRETSYIIRQFILILTRNNRTAPKFCATGIKCYLKEKRETL